MEEMKSMDIKFSIEAEDGDPRLPIYCHYDGQTQPQGGVIEIHPEGRSVTVFSDPEIGGAVPVDAWHGVKLRVACSPSASPEGLQRWFDSQRETIERVIKGWSGAYDHASNWKGGLSDDGLAAMSLLEESAQQIDQTPVSSANDGV